MPRPNLSKWEQNSPDEAYNDNLYCGWLEDYLQNEIPECLYFFPDNFYYSEIDDENSDDFFINQSD